ncbi:hypothetical protein IMSAGC003_03550 [Lachnospiraceae bacterium]|nr:hypothetical protein IMSAGC003_03550 [Lachnospiraceae bacterium]
MRKHTVNCRIEGDKAEAGKIVCQAANQFYAELIERLLEQSGWKKEVRLELLDRMIDIIKNQTITAPLCGEGSISCFPKGDIL